MGNQGTHSHHTSTDIATQQLQQFDELSIDSRFDNGSLAEATQAAPGKYELDLATDCYKTQYETGGGGGVWFYFKVSNVDLKGHQSRTICFKIKNMRRSQYNNYVRQKMVPVFASPALNKNWQYLTTPLDGCRIVGPNLELKWHYNFTAAEREAGVYFAFTFPYTYTDCLNFIGQLEANYLNHPYVYFHRETLTYSHEGRPIELLTITGHDHSLLDGSKQVELEPLLVDLFPTHPRNFNEKPTLENRSMHRPFIFRNKKYVFITTRVHPGEPPANYMLQGLIQSLLTDPQDPINQALLKDFVFVIMPMLNVDGVIKGYNRTDARGINWQMAYHLAQGDHKLYSGAYGVLEIAKCLAADGRLVCYLDLHAHSNKNAAFVYGTWLRDHKQRVEMRTFAKILDVYSKNFDYCESEFGSQQMTENADPTKFGVAKTEVRKQAGVLHAYTLETSFHITIKDPERYDPARNPGRVMNKQCMRRIGIEEFFEVGDGIKNAILEMFGEHPKSILPYTCAGDKECIRKEILEIMKSTWKTPQQKKDEEAKGKENASSQNRPGTAPLDKVEHGHPHGHGPSKDQVHGHMQGPGMVYYPNPGYIYGLGQGQVQDHGHPYNQVQGESVLNYPIQGQNMQYNQMQGQGVQNFQPQMQGQGQNVPQYQGQGQGQSHVVHGNQPIHQ